MTDWLKRFKGEGFRDFMTTNLLGEIDLYVSGHDHNLQFFADASLRNPCQGFEESWVDPPGTAFAVVGSAAKCKWPGKKGHRNDASFEAFAFGFAVVEATGSDLSVTFHYIAGRKKSSTTGLKESSDGKNSEGWNWKSLTASRTLDSTWDVPEADDDQLDSGCYDRDEGSTCCRGFEKKSEG